MPGSTTTGASAVMPGSTTTGASAVIPGPSTTGEGSAIKFSPTSALQVYGRTNMRQIREHTYSGGLRSQCGTSQAWRLLNDT